ncbi:MULTISPECIES: hybrid sensor histidine kinase/response regulator [Komagataeibacter]|uniref:Chemotaxis protein CheA n=7 Tax=Komagataeibacter saccharivorans TaxID=265959 RepID=A0A347WCU9_9PROT|nr:response regulator [Komagataeibacter saccharivorans]AXY22692.1 Gliding motility regulatory protein [Komagataeibacter saccharivorans]PMP98468.1 Histidine kinase [Komagataeibacter saccharivorans]PYD51986.1 hybrid sensor histidine kinase/response regulator [Komagataeibacter saccharivorans]GBQ39211.1 two component response regulator [Komagataeibacter saccharivorans NRIC 0614]
MDNLRDELLAVFDAEYRDHLRAIRGIVAAGCPDARAVAEIFRRVHSLKGAARAVELPVVEGVAHTLENRLSTLLAAGSLPDAADLKAITDTLDEIDLLMTSAPPDTDVVEDVSVQVDNPAYVQVPVARLDALASAVHDLMSVADRHERLWGQVMDLLADQRAVMHAPEHMRADPVAEFARMTRRLMAVGRERELMAGQIDRALLRLGEEVHAVTLVPAESVFGSLAAMARRIAREHGGPEAGVEVHMSGMGVQTERRVMQALRDPVIHLVRNAIVHGHETRAQRLKAGKSERLNITISVTLTGVRLQVAVSDDGRGPDLRAIAARAAGQGLVHADAPLDARQLLARVFEPGFSTRGQADSLAGRGVGLSVVAEAARALHGTVRMEQRQPAGTTVTLTVPVSQRQRTVLLVENAGQTLGLPGRVIRHLLRIRREEIRMLNGMPFGVVPHPPDGTRPEIAPPAEEELVALVPLHAFVGDEDAALPVRDGAVSVAVMEVDGVRCGFAVERMLDVRTLLVSDATAVGLDSELVPGIAWARDDQPVFVLSPDRLFARWRLRGNAGVVRFSDVDSAAPIVPVRHAPLVMVVDDSITTRTLQKTILQSHGYDVCLAVDGEEALALLQQSSRHVDVVVTDVEMPRMDGFGLLAAMQADPHLAGIPVVLMTSRDDGDDVRRGMEGGARAYLTKQKFDQGELIDTIRGLL